MTDQRPGPPDERCTCGAKIKAIKAHSRRCPQWSEEDSDWCAKQWMGTPGQTGLVPAPDDHGELLRQDLLKRLRQSLATLLPEGADPTAVIEKVGEVSIILSRLVPQSHLPPAAVELQVDPVQYEGDPAVHALAARIGDLVQHMDRHVARADRYHLLQEIREEITRLEGELNPLRMLDASTTDGPVLLPVHAEEASVRHAAGLLVQGVLSRLADGRPDHGALHNAAWKALRVLSPAAEAAAVEKIDERAQAHASGRDGADKDRGRD